MEIVSFTRIHTASLTISVVVIAALLSGYSYLYLLLFGVFALLFHMFGFSINNITDYRYDLEDPYKGHFPSVSGAVNMKHATIAAITGTVLSYAFGAWIIDFSSLPMIFMSVALVSGIAYNLVNKISPAGPLLISLSFTMLIPYVMMSVTANVTVMVLYAVFAFMTMYYQIGVSGYLKDIEVNQYNFMSSLGMKLIAGKIIFTSRNRIYAQGLRIAVLIDGLAIIVVTGFNIITAPVFVILQMVVLIRSMHMLRNGAWIRTVYLKRMSAIEVINYLSLAVLFAPAYGLWWLAFMTAFPVIWFAAFNRMFFGTISAPRV